ncbi:MAG: aspartate/glutamate racemase family protein [Asticcacaulis sp.]|uniref:aspartate/glutamate racemase family protein n=1 Tax=Asticcacaulis sp. TaxID=1872648 RepID=UPI003F7B7D69
MRTIGLLGGMSWESTATYYKLINEGVRAARGGLASADILLRSVNFDEIVALQRANNWDEAGRVLGEAARGLEQAGAEAILICTNTMHLVADSVADSVNIPLIHIIDETARALTRAGKRRPLLLATRYTMEHGFYSAYMRTHGVEVLTPERDDRDRCHHIIFDELCQGVVSRRSRAALRAITERGKAMGADSVILGCTELGLSVSPSDLSLPCFDSTYVHADAAVAFALQDTAELRRAS